MRGRNNNNNNGGHRRGPNPLTRSYESNGPDVKIRGTAQHIGEKYLQLARDAQTSGDPVAAESYLQHAEHYFRIIAAAQQAQQQAQGNYVRQPGEAESEEVESDDDLVMPDRFSLPSERFPAPQQQGGNGTGPQPYADRGGYNGGGERQQNDRPQAERQQGDRQQGERQPYGQERYDRQPGNNEYRAERQDRDQRQDRGDRQDRDQRPYADRNGYERNNGGDRPQGERNFRNDRAPRNQRFNREGGDYREARNDRDGNGYRDNRFQQPEGLQPQPLPPADVVAPQEAAELPAFITAPVRPSSTPADTPDVGGEVVAAAPAPTPEVPAAEDAGETFAVRPRRRRRTRAAIEADNAAAGAGDEPSSAE